MKPRDRAKHTGRRERGNFTLIPHAVQDSPNWKACSGTAVKLLCDLARQYRGHNNGDLCAAMSVLKAKGWTSPETVNFALRELRHYGLLILTRQGGLHAASLYALSWQPIDDCRGKLDCAATTKAPGCWRDVPAEPFKRPARNRKPTTQPVATLLRIAKLPSANGADFATSSVAKPPKSGKR